MRMTTRLLFALTLFPAIQASLGYRYRYRALQAAIDPTTCPAADKTVTKTCLESYYGSYGIHVSPLQEFSAYAAALKLFQKLHGKDSVNEICSRMNVLNICLKSASQNCISPAFYKDVLALKYEEALAYAANYAAQDYECSNKQVLLDNYDCIERVSTNMTAELANCGRVLTSGERCSSYPSYIDCTAKLFSSTCAINAPGPLYQFICASEKAGIMMEAPECASKLPECKSGASVQSIFFSLFLITIALFTFVTSE